MRLRPEYIYIYILIYKLKADYNLWIIKKTDIIDDVNIYKSLIENVESKHEKYYLIERKIKKPDLENELKFKHFMKFISNKNDVIIEQSS
tara:strand:+ start:575 stop:844 length:270 start_codon:yes stop_codon:yes gene_type:complete